MVQKELFMYLTIVKIRGTNERYIVTIERTGEFGEPSHTGGIYIPLQHVYNHMFWNFYVSYHDGYTVQDYFNFNCAHGSMEDMWFIH